MFQPGNQTSPQKKGSSENGHGLFSRLLSTHHHSGGHDERSVAHHTVNLLTSTIKVDADQTDLRFCFRIISPAKTYTLQVPSQDISVGFDRARGESNSSNIEYLIDLLTS